MAKTLISDIVIPEVFDPYFIKRTAELSNLIASGIVVPDPKLDTLAASGGTIITMPFFTDLDGADQILDDSNPLVVANIGTATDMARLHLRGDARSVNDLAQALSGDDPLAAIVDLIAGYWTRKEQALLIKTLEGVFTDNDDNDDGDLIYVHAAEASGDVKAWNDSSPTVMSPDAIVSGQALLGDNMDKFTAIIMHSKCLTDLIKQELIDYERPSGATTKIPYYLDKRIIVDDGCPKRDGSGSPASTVYQSYLFATGAIGRGEGGAPVPSELERSALDSDTRLITRRHFLLHPRGFKWVEGSISGKAPTNLECSDGTHFDRVYEQKQCRCVMIETN